MPQKAEVPCLEVAPNVTLSFNSYKWKMGFNNNQCVYLVLEVVVMFVIGDLAVGGKQVGLILDLG